MESQYLDELEADAIRALVASSQAGNATAASQALLAVQRIREKNAAAIHAARMKDLEGDSEKKVEYLATLGLTEDEVVERVGHRLTAMESAALQRGHESLFLEVRAVELQRMRSRGDVPRWAKNRSDR